MNSSGKQPKQVSEKLETGSSSLYAEMKSSSPKSVPLPHISTAEEQSIAPSTAKRSKSSVTTTPNSTPCQTLSNVSISTLFNLFANSSVHKDIKTQSGAVNSLERYSQPLKLSTSQPFDTDMQGKVDEDINLEIQEDVLAISPRKDTSIGTPSMPIHPIATSTTRAQSVSSDSTDGVEVSDLTYFHECGYSPDTLPDETSNVYWDSLSSESGDDKADGIKVYSHPEYSHPYPFPSVSSEWYEKQRALELHDAAREE